MSKGSNILWFNHISLGKLPLESEVHLLVVRRDHVLIHVPWIRGRRKPVQVRQPGGVGEGEANQPGARDRPDRLPVLERSEKVIREKRWIEADVLEDVIVDPVIHDTATCANDEFLVAEKVPGKARPGRKVVCVFVPQFMITGLEVFRSNARIERNISREELICCCRWGGSYGRAKV